jgi:RNA polymerase sigma factor (sigma-70 family)
MEIANLIQEAKEGSAAAQKCIFDLLSDKMLLVCCRYVKGREDAEEILLDGFCKFFMNLPGFHYQGEGPLFAWIKKIMINECLMFLRKKNAFQMVTEADAQLVPLEEELFSKLSAEAIFSVILQLPLGYRTVFNLHAIEGMKHSEIASLLGISEGTSKSQLSKARSLLQKLLSQKEASYVTRKTK